MVTVRLCGVSAGCCLRINVVSKSLVLAELGTGCYHIIANPLHRYAGREIIWNFSMASLSHHSGLPATLNQVSAQTGYACRERL